MPIARRRDTRGSSRGAVPSASRDPRVSESQAVRKHWGDVPGRSNNVMPAGEPLNAVTPFKPGNSFLRLVDAEERGLANAAGSTTRFYISHDGTGHADEMLLSCHAAVPPSARSARRTSTVTVPLSAPLEDYLLIACADARSAVTLLGCPSDAKKRGPSGLSCPE